jgi:hypothetical protein
MNMLMDFASDAARSIPDNAYHRLPDEAGAQAAVAAFMEAAAAAEVAQKQLLQDSRSSSWFAELLADQSQLFKVAEAYSELQRLHHMAIQQKLQQYGSTAATLPGFVKACLAEAAEDKFLPAAGLDALDGDRLSLHTL